MFLFSVYVILCPAKRFPTIKSQKFQGRLFLIIFRLLSFHTSAGNVVQSRRGLRIQEHFWQIRRVDRMARHGSTVGGDFADLQPHCRCIIIALLAWRGRVYYLLSMRYLILSYYSALSFVRTPKSKEIITRLFKVDTRYGFSLADHSRVSRSPPRRFVFGCCRRISTRSHGKTIKIIVAGKTRASNFATRCFRLRTRATGFF